MNLRSSLTRHSAIACLMSAFCLPAVVQAGFEASTVVGALAPTVYGFAPQAGTVQFRFKNNEGVEACAVHVKLSASVTWDRGDLGFTWQSPAKTFPNTNGHNSSTIVLQAADCSDPTQRVLNGNTLTIGLNFAGARFPVIQRWWWADATGARIGVEKLPRLKRMKFLWAQNIAAAGASGNGVVSIDACGETPVTFNTTLGEDEATSAASFVAKIQLDFPLQVPVFVDPVDPTTAVFAGGCFGDAAEDAEIVVTTQDSAGSMEVTTVFAENIPAVSEWGLIAMMLLVLAAGTLVLRRGQRATA